MTGSAGPSDLSPAFAEVLGIVAAARRRVQTGGSVELADLPAKVEKSCAWLLGLPREEGQLYGELLLSLKRDLDALADAVQQRRAELSRRLAPDGAE